MEEKHTSPPDTRSADSARVSSENGSSFGHAQKGSGSPDGRNGGARDGSHDDTGNILDGHEGFVYRDGRRDSRDLDGNTHVHAEEPESAREAEKTSSEHVILPPQDREPLEIRTLHKVASAAELNDHAELRAYKLGKRRWLYNECRLNFIRFGTTHSNIHVVEASSLQTANIPPHLEECAVAFSCRLTNQTKVTVYIYLVYDAPKEVPALAANGMESRSGQREYQWFPVSRADCNKNCQDNILRAIQRFGRVSKRTRRSGPSRDAADMSKDPRYLYLSIDEATSHVRGKRFRLIAAAYGEGTGCLGTSLSLPINVLANNDAPHGPAQIEIDLPLSESWEGWAISEQNSKAEGGTPTARLYRQMSMGTAYSGREGLLRGMSGGSEMSSVLDPRDPENQLSFIKKRAWESTSPDDAHDEMGARGHRYINAQRALTYGDPVPGNSLAWRTAHQQQASYWDERQNSVLTHHPSILPSMVESQPSMLGYHGHSLAHSSQTRESMFGMPSAYTFAASTHYDPRIQSPQAYYATARQASAPAMIQDPRVGASGYGGSYNGRQWSTDPYGHNVHMYSVPPGLGRSASGPLLHDPRPEPMIPVPQVQQAQNPIVSNEEQRYEYNPFAADPETRTELQWDIPDPLDPADEDTLLPRNWQ